MYVSREEMESLYEKILLEDLTDVLSPETVERIFPRVLECGRIDGRQIGLAMEAESLLAGDKDAATVTGIIQSRVRLYLAEHSHTG